MWVQLRFATWARLAVLFRGQKRYQTRAKRWQVRGGRRRNSSSTASVIRLKYPPFAFCLSSSVCRFWFLPPTSVAPLSVSSPSVRSQPHQEESCFSALNLSAADNAFRKKEVLAGAALGTFCRFQFCLTEESQAPPRVSQAHILSQVLLWGRLVQIVSMLAFAPCSVQFHVCRSRGSPQADTGVLWRWSSPLKNPAGTQTSASPLGPSSSRKAWARARRWGTLKGTASCSHVLPGREPHG